jgi:hypothetical protein
MNAIYSITAPSGSTQGALNRRQWPQGDTALSSGYTSMVPVQINGKLFLFAFNKATQQLDAYILSGSDPWVQQTSCKVNLPHGPWDTLNSFVLGNVSYLLTYRADTGGFGFFAVASDLTVSPPYIFVPSHSTPSKGFTTVATYTSLGGQYVLGYDSKTGRVENFNVTVVPSSTGGKPPLLALNIWYHTWAPNWTQFAFFQLGGSTFFFKINISHDTQTNKPKLNNVNIDHMQDNPAMGSIEVGSELQDQLPDAVSINVAAIIPWAHGEPYLLTYIASSGKTAMYQIRSDCLGWTLQISTITIAGASIAVPYRIGDTSYILLYSGEAVEKSG